MLLDSGGQLGNASRARAYGRPCLQDLPDLRKGAVIASRRVIRVGLGGVLPEPLLHLSHGPARSAGHDRPVFWTGESHAREAAATKFSWFFSADQLSVEAGRGASSISTE